MRHKYAGYKLKRTTSGRDALLRNLATSIIEAERVVTTVPKAKAVRPLVEHMITLAKTDTLHSRRQAAMVLRTKNFGRKSLNEIKEILANMGLGLGMRIDQHGRLVAPPPSSGGGPDFGPEDEGQPELGE